MTLTAQDKALRLTGIGGSDIGAICGLSRYRKPIDVWREKRGEDLYTESEPAIWGTVLEEPIAREYARRHGCRLAGPMQTFVSDVAMWHLMSLDRLEVTGNGDDEFYDNHQILPERSSIVRLIEIKTANWYSGHSFGLDGSDDLPMAYLAQVAWYLAGLNISSATVAALINTSDYREFHVERDMELEGYLLERGEAFWKLVESGTPPEPDGSDSFKRYLQTRFSRTTDIMIPSSPDIEQVAAKLRSVRAVARVVDREQKLLEQQLQNAIGEADGGETADGKITYKFEQRGKVRHSGLIEELLQDANMSADHEAAYMDRFRGRAGRRLLVPRAWSKDEIAIDAAALLGEGK